MAGMSGMASPRVAVLMGGLSAEREVSLVTGRSCARALREAGYDQVIEVEGLRKGNGLLDGLLYLFRYHMFAERGGKMLNTPRNNDFIGLYRNKLNGISQIIGP